jgi:hypothetical protein
MRREPGHQGIDLFPVPGGAEPGFADQEFARLAACEIEHLGGDETVEHNHVGRLQRANRTHRKQVRIGWRVDDDDRSILDAGSLLLNSGHQAAEVGPRRLALGVRHGMLGEQPPEGAARGERQLCGLDGRTPMLRRPGPGRKALGQQHLQPCADGLGEHRRGAVGGNSNDQWRTVDDRAEGEVAEGRFVDDVDWYAGLARGLREASRVRFVGKRADGNGGGSKIARDPRAPVQHDRAARRSVGECAQLCGNFLGIDVDLRTSRRQQLRLPGRRGTAASQHRAFAGEREEDRQPRDRRHAARAYFSVRAMHTHEQMVSQRRVIFLESRLPRFRITF